MRTIVLASNNEHKIKEFKQIFKEDKIVSLKDIGFNEDIEENGNSFLENAIIKAKTIHNYLNSKNIEAYVIADDSGLCVNALNGMPGIYSARYAGEHNDVENRKKLLEDLKNEINRSAYFVCCIVEYLPSGKYIYAEGKAHGYILEEETGDKSFGYDCLFFSSELCKSFGEATDEEKNRVSHRRKAIENIKKLETQLVFKRN